MKNHKTERFIKYWSKERQKGKEKAIFLQSIIFASGALTVIIIISLYRDDIMFLDFSYYISQFSVFFIGGLIGNTLGWYNNEKKYNKLIKNSKE